MRDHLELRDCWDVVEFAISHRNQVGDWKDKAWATKNLLAKINIKHNLSRADLHDVSASKFAGDVWNHLFNKNRNVAAQRAIADVLDWKMPPGMRPSKRMTT